MPTLSTLPIDADNIPMRDAFSLLANTNRWALRLNPFLFSNPFEKLFEGLFEFEQELDN